MLELDENLPEAALIDSYQTELAAAMTGEGKVWLHGTAEALQCEDDGIVSGWQSVCGTYRAIPTEPNDGNGQIMRSGEGYGLLCQGARHCGLHLPEMTSRSDVFTMAVLYRRIADAEPRTLLTLNGSGRNRSENYLFLSDDGETLVVKDTNQAIVLPLPRHESDTDLRCVVVTLSGDRLLVQDSGGPIHEVTGVPPGLPAPASLFIGARSHRSGLQKTLGDSVIEDVLFWPGQRLLGPLSEEDSRQARLLARYYLWRR